MQNYRIRWGETLSALVDLDDPQALMATLTIGSNPTIVQPGTFIDGVADVSVSADDTKIAVGVYDYEIELVYSDGRVQKFPDPSASCDDCDDDTTFYPTIEILPSLSMPETSGVS